MKSKFIRDFWLSIFTLLVMTGIYYASPFQDWQKCRGMDKMLLSERPDLYEDLNCPKVIKEELYDTKLGFSLAMFSNENTKINKPDNTKNSNNTSIVVLLFISLVFLLAYALSAFFQAVYLHCYLVAILLVFSPFIFLVLLSLRKELPMAFLTFIVSYSVIVSALYGMIFSPVVIIGSFFSFSAFVFIVSFTLLAEFIQKFK